MSSRLNLVKPYLSVHTVDCLNRFVWSLGAYSFLGPECKTKQTNKKTQNKTWLTFKAAGFACCQDSQTSEREF